MTTLAKLNVELSASTDGITSSLSKSQKQVQDWTNEMEESAGKVDSFFRDAFSFAFGGLVQSALGKVADGISGLIGGMVDGNAQFEDYNVQFKIMLGSAELAKDRLDDLAEFGAKTPFELPDVVEADKVLQGFGLHSLEAARKFGFSGEQIRTIAGDVASATGVSFSEMALNIGKFSQGATGEAIARFMELGVLTRDELRKMGVEFSKSGELISPLPEATNAMLEIMRQKYGGLMEAQSTTFNGMRSNLQDWIGNALRIMGAPVFDVLKDHLAKLLSFLNSNSPKINQFFTSIGTVAANVLGNSLDFVAKTVIPSFVGAWRLVRPAVEVAANALRMVGAILSTIGKMAAGWGENIINQLAGGIKSAAGKVVASLKSIGGIITYWLRPHSPPKLLPSLDDWGAGAATAYMDGWSMADFGALDDMAGQIESVLNSIAGSGGMGQEGVIPALLGSKSVISEMIKSMKDMGSVGEDAFQRLREAAGPAADVAEQLMREYINVEDSSREVASAQIELARATQRVTDAQENLNNVTARYDAELSPIVSELDKVERQLDDVRDAEKALKLQAIIDDADSSALEKQEAQLELQQMQLKQLIRAKEDEKAAAVATAQASVDAALEEQKAAEAKLEIAKDNEEQAKQQYQATQKLISVQQSNNDLVAEQVRLLQDLAQKADDASGGGGGGGLSGLADSAGDFGAMLDPLAMGLEPVGAALAETATEGDNAGFSFDQIAASSLSLIEKISQLSVVFQVIKGVAEQVFPTIRDVVLTAFDIVKSFIEQHGSDIVAFFTDAWGRVQLIISGVVKVISDVVIGIFSGIQGFLQSHGDEIGAAIGDTWETIKVVIETALTLIDSVIRQILMPIAEFIREHGEIITGIIGFAWEAIHLVIKITLGAILALMKGIMTIINADWGTVWEGMKVLVGAIWEGIKNIVSGALSFLMTAFVAGLGAIGSFFMGWWETLKDGVKVATDWIISIVSAAWGTLSDATSSLFSNIGTGITGAFDSIVSRMKGIVNGAIRSINSIVGALNSVSSALGFGNVISEIPQLAKGTNNWMGGPAIVSERGMEYAEIPGIGEGLIGTGLYNLPRGSEITPARETAEMFSSKPTSAASGNTYNITYNRGTAEREDVIGDIQSLRVMYGGLG